MMLDAIKSRGLVLVGCGRMGTALLKGWLRAGIDPTCVSVTDPSPPAEILECHLNVNGALPASPAVVLLAIKPQSLAKALPRLVRFGNGSTLILSIAAGLTIEHLQKAFGASTPIIRAMPNTPAMVGKGMTAMIENSHVGPEMLEMAKSLMATVGDVALIEKESDMDIVTAVSGSGPAYVFYLIETLAAAAVAQGMRPDLALRIARATVSGAGFLSAVSHEGPAELRANVTSPGGTTAAALGVLMDECSGLAPLIARTVAAAVLRSSQMSPSVDRDSGSGIAELARQK